SIDPATQELMQETTGMQPMQTATGLDAFYRSLALPYDQILVAEGDLAQMRRALFSERPIEPGISPLPAAAAQSVASETDGAVFGADSLIEKDDDYLSRQCAEMLKLT